MPVNSPDASSVIRIPGYAAPRATQSILYLKGANNYSAVHLLGCATPLLTSKPLKTMEGRLPTFLRVSKAYLINPVHVVTVFRQNAANMRLTLLDGTVVVVSRRRIKAVTARLLAASHSPRPPLTGVTTTRLVAPAPAHLFPAAQEWCFYRE